MSKSVLLITRNKMKAKKPKFERQDVNIFRQFRGTWRKPKGIHSKLRRGFKGHKASPSIGYSGPKSVKGLTRDGLLPVLVSNIKELDKINQDCAVVIGHCVGTKKRLQILNKAKEKKIRILGVKDIDALVTQLGDKFNSRKKTADETKAEKKKKVDSEKSKETKSEEKKDEPKK